MFIQGIRRLLPQAKPRELSLPRAMTFSRLEMVEIAIKAGPQIIVSEISRAVSEAARAAVCRVYNPIVEKLMSQFDIPGSDI